jgi:RNA-directed DNA polymerase
VSSGGDLELEFKQKTRKRSFKALKGEAASALEMVHSSNPAKPSTENPSQTVLMEEVLERENMLLALKRVMSNKGCPGWDGMSVEELPEYLRQNWAVIKSQMESGAYRPGLVSRVKIPKPEGGERKLGIPTVVDRMIQQALQQVLSRIFEPSFSDRSFGFRPGRSCHQAIDLAQQEIRSGRNIVVDVDLESFFDRVNHDRLMSRLSERISDKRVLRLIGAYLRAGILERGLVTTPDEGTPQGGPLSPLLSNIVLDELDRELERRGHRFVRYADDCNIYVRTERAGKRVMSGVKQFIEKKLKLKVNVKKSAVAPAYQRKFLGITFSKRGDKVRVSEQAIKRFKTRVRNLTRRQSRDLGEQIADLSRYLQGWIGYYGRSEVDWEIKSLDQWIRRRLRVLHLKRWRTPKTRFREFERLGMRRNDCKFISHTTKRYWYLSGTKAVTFTLNLQYFRKLGLYFMLDRYKL